jgi:hypothetical protein
MWHAWGRGEWRGVYRVLVRRPEGKRLLGRPRRRWEDNIKLDLREIGIDGANWLQLAQEISFSNNILHHGIIICIFTLS